MGPSGCGKTTLLGELQGTPCRQRGCGWPALHRRPSRSCLTGPLSAADTLAGRLAKSARSTGDIRVNGHKSKLSFGRSAYVTQDDVRVGGLGWPLVWCSV